MRTTLTIDQDVLLAARDFAAVEGRTVGDVISAWARDGLTMTRRTSVCENDDWLSTHGLTLLPRRDEIVTTADVNRLREELFL